MFESRYPNDRFPFKGNEKALFDYLIEFSTHNVRLIPIPSPNMSAKHYYQNYEFVPYYKSPSLNVRRQIEYIKRNERKETDLNENMKKLQKIYQDKIDVVLNKFQHTGIPLCDFVRIFDWYF